MGNAVGLPNRWRRLKVLAEVAGALLVASRLPALAARHLWLGRLSSRLSSYSPLQLVAGAWAASHAWARASLLLGLNAPHSSLYSEPDCHYSREFRWIRWLLTGLDAGVLTAMRIRQPLLRDTMAILLSLYYLVFARRAENKVAAFRRSQTIESLRATWQKGEHPLLAAVAGARRPALACRARALEVPRAEGEGGGAVPCSLWFAGDDEQLRRVTRLVLHFPGGGFVAMSPRHHEDYLAHWAKQLGHGVAVVSVDYRKAPEHPYPAGFQDCLRVYRRTVETEGGALGVGGGGPLSVALAGDSAGGNLAAGVTLRCLELGVRPPAGVHMIYPVLDMAGMLWRSEHLNEADGGGADGPPEPSSRARYAFDGVLPLKYMLKIGEAYLARGADPHSDYMLSPLRAPRELLARFPPSFLHVGSVDPLVDDSKEWVARVREANPGARTELRLIPGVSHAYMHVISFLPAAKAASKLSVLWLREIFAAADTAAPVVPLPAAL